MSQGPLSTLRRRADGGAPNKDGKFTIISPAILEKLQSGIPSELDYDLVNDPPKVLLPANSAIGDPANFFFTYDVVTGAWVLLHHSVKTRSFTAPPEVAAAIAAKTPLALRDRVVYCYFTKAWFIVDPPQAFSPPQLYYVPVENVLESSESLPAAVELYSYKSSTVKPQDAPTWIMRPEAHTALYVHRGQFCTFDRVSCTWQSETSDPLYQTLLSGRRGVKVHLADPNALSSKLLTTLLTTVFKDLATGIGAPLEQVLDAAASVVAGGTGSFDTSVSSSLSPRTPDPNAIDKTGTPRMTESPHPKYITTILGTQGTGTNQDAANSSSAAAQVTAVTSASDDKSTTQTDQHTIEPVSDDKVDDAGAQHAETSTGAATPPAKETTVSTVSMPATTKVDRKEAWV